MKGKNKIWQVTKEYDKESFNDDITSLGYAIDVYQESINKTIREYLVNFNYLTRIMEDYGFIIIDDQESNSIGFNSGFGSFSDIYRDVELKIKENPRYRKDIGTTLNMSINEKKISFFNKYFIFKKIRIVNPDEISKNLFSETSETIIPDINLTNVDEIPKDTSEYVESIKPSEKPMASNLKLN